MTHCDRCKGEYNRMITAEKKAFEGGVLTVTDIPARKCECDILTDVSDGVIIDGYRGLLESKGIIGKVEVSLEELKSRFKPMDFLQPYLKS
jgi:hypothetical protein